jgi:hypothetical protein
MKAFFYYTRHRMASGDNLKTAIRIAARVVFPIKRK